MLPRRLDRAENLSGEHEYDRKIFHYFVRLYEGSTLVFHGIIYISFVSHNAKTDIVYVTCYGYLWLFAKFADQTMLSYGIYVGVYYSSRNCDAVIKLVDTNHILRLFLLQCIRSS